MVAVITVWTYDDIYEDGHMITELISNGEFTRRCIIPRESVKKNATKSEVMEYFIDAFHHLPKTESTSKTGSAEITYARPVVCVKELITNKQ